MKYKVTTDKVAELIRQVTALGANLITPTKSEGVYILNGPQITHNAVRDMVNQGLAKIISISK